MQAHSLHRRYAAALWILWALFFARVLGQMAVAVFGVSFLPSMDAWQSGLLPYSWLVASQIGILLLYGKACLDFTRGTGFFARPDSLMGKALLALGAVYFTGMLARYVVQIGLHPIERWRNDLIPIVFHWVLAAFLLTVGWFHKQQSQK